MTCTKIIKAWFGSSLAIKFADLPNPNFPAWLYNNIVHRDKDILIQMVTLIYNIWHARNLSVFKYKGIPEEDIIQRDNRNIQDFLQAQISTASHPTLGDTQIHVSLASGVSSHSHTSRTSDSAPIAKWKKPAEGLFKTNYDMSLRVKGKWGIGSIIRSDHGLVMAAATWVTNGSGNILEAEAYGVLKALKFLQECCFREINIEGDNEGLMRRLKDGRNDKDSSYLGLMIKEIHQLQSRFDTCLFTFIPRSGSKVAHNLAQLAHLEPNVVWIEVVLVTPRLPNLICFCIKSE